MNLNPTDRAVLLAYISALEDCGRHHLELWRKDGSVVDYRRLGPVVGCTACAEKVLDCVLKFLEKRP